MRYFTLFIPLLLFATAVNGQASDAAGTGVQAAARLTKLPPTTPTTGSGDDANPVPVTSRTAGNQPDFATTAGPTDQSEATLQRENAARLAAAAKGRMVFYAPAHPDLRPRARRVAAIAAGSPVEMARIGAVRPKMRSLEFPNARWSNRQEGLKWTRAAVSALKTHGASITRTVPKDIDAWCPAYRAAGEKQRRAFWVGFLSALAKHESTWNPQAVGGGGLWYGLLQILPGTARGYRCHARTGAELKNGAANLSCAIRIMSVTVPRDQAIAVHNGRWRGVAADWGPMTSASKRREMSAWLRKQSYCKPLSSRRPVARPAGLVLRSDG